MEWFLSMLYNCVILYFFVILVELYSFVITYYIC
jgi:hypothetical protein